jgi:hypothetical protein
MLGVLRGTYQLFLPSEHQNRIQALILELYPDLYSLPRASPPNSNGGFSGVKMFVLFI